MGKKKGKNKQRNLKKQPQHDNGITEDLPVEKADKADDVINTSSHELDDNKINSLGETAINEIISINVRQKLENSSSNSETEKEELKSARQKLENSSSNSETEKEELKSARQKLENSSSNSETEKEELKSARQKLENSSSNSETEKEELKSARQKLENSSSNSETEKEELKSATSEIVQIPQSLKECTPSKSTECLSVIGNLSITTDSRSSNSINWKGDEKQRFLGTKSNSSTLLSEESEQGTITGENSLLTKKESKTTSGEAIESSNGSAEQATIVSGFNLERENTFLTESNEILDSENSVQENVTPKSKPSLDSGTKIHQEEGDKATEIIVNKNTSVPPDTIDNVIEPCNLVDGKNNDLDRNVINNTNEMMTESSNSAERSINRNSRIAENDCTSDAVENENLQEEKNRFSTPTDRAKEDMIITDKIRETQEPATQPELKILPRTSTKSMVTSLQKVKSAEDKIPKKKGSEKTNKKNKKSSFNKSKTTLESSLDNEDKVQLNHNIEKHTTIHDSLSHESHDNEDDDSFQLGLTNSTSSGTRNVHFETSIDESNPSIILETSKGNDSTRAERLDAFVRPDSQDSKITLFQRGHDTNTLTSTSTIQYHSSLQNSLEDINHVQNETNNSPIHFPLTKMIENQSVQDQKPSSYGGNKIEDNTDRCPGSLEGATSNITTACKNSQFLGKNQQFPFEVVSNFSVTDPESKSSKVVVESNLSLEETLKIEKPNEAGILLKDERLNAGNSNNETSSLIKMHNDLLEDTNEAEKQGTKSKEEHQIINRLDPTVEELIPPANKRESARNVNIPCNDKEEESIRKSSKGVKDNGKPHNQERVEDLLKEELYNEKAANSNSEALSSKKKSRLHKCQRKNEKGQTTVKIDGNVPYKDKSISENKNPISANSEEASESKQSKKQSKSTSISKNVKVGGNEAITDNKKLISSSEKANTFNTTNKNNSDDEKQIPLDSMAESRLLQADSLSETFPVRPIFMANTCHVCKKTHGGEIRLKSCSACRLIAYCSKEHQRKHWKEHKSLCKQIQKNINQNNLQDLYGNASKIKDPEEWRIYRCFQLTKTEKMMGRPLLPYEREMFLYPRVCSTCHKSDPEKLKVCKQCHYINYCCSEHLPKEHHNWCKELRLLLEINQYQSSYGLIRPQIPLVNLEKIKPFPKDMKTFITTLISIEKNTNVYNLYESALSDIASYPLTVLYVLEYFSKENAKGSLSSNKLTIHVIGAERQFEVDTPSKWDVFLLNLLPNVAELHLVFIGPELIPKDNSDINDNCRKISYKSLDSTKKFFLEFHYGELYHEYVKESTYSKPDIICAFNCGIYRYTGYDNQDTWGPTILSMVKHKYIPIVLTAYTEVEAPKDVERFEKECNVQVVIPPSKNPFASIKPNLNFVSDDKTPLIYKNQYFSVLQGVDHKSNSQ